MIRTLSFLGLVATVLATSFVGWADIIGVGGSGTPVPEYGLDPTVNEPFPTTGDAYLADSGPGTIPAGGYTGASSTAGDYVQSALFTGTGLTSLTDLNFNLTASDNLEAGNQENWLIYVNGVYTGWYAFVNCSGSGFCSGDISFSFTATFGDIAPVAGGYQIEMKESQTFSAIFGCSASRGSMRATA